MVIWPVPIQLPTAQTFTSALTNYSTVVRLIFIKLLPVSNVSLAVSNFNKSDTMIVYFVMNIDTYCNDGCESLYQTVALFGLLTAYVTGQILLQRVLSINMVTLSL